MANWVGRRSMNVLGSSDCDSLAVTEGEPRIESVQAGERATLDVKIQEAPTQSNPLYLHIGIRDERLAQFDLPRERFLKIEGSRYLVRLNPDHGEHQKIPFKTFYRSDIPSTELYVTDKFDCFKGDHQTAVLSVCSPVLAEFGIKDEMADFERDGRIHYVLRDGHSGEFVIKLKGRASADVRGWMQGDVKCIHLPEKDWTIKKGASVARVGFTARASHYPYDSMCFYFRHNDEEAVGYPEIPDRERFIVVEVYK